MPNSKRPVFNGPGLTADFDCVACMESQHGTPVNIHGDLLCEKCFTRHIIPQFHNALKSETQFPVVYGGAEIDIWRVSRFFSNQFLDEWDAKKLEYAIPLADRLYCATTDCGRFLGKRHRHRVAKKCLGCGGQTCADCSASITNAQHVCQQAEQQADAFEGLQRGRDWQKCPGCSTAVQLTEACNHMTCKVASCNTHFCWLCGERATGDSGHWSYGKPCPKYGQPSAANAVFDRVPLADLDDGEDVRIAINQGVRAAWADMAVPIAADAPEEVRARHADLLILERTIRDFPGQMRAARLNGDDVDALRQLLCLGMMAAALTSSLDVYTLHLEPDQDRQMARLAEINRVHRIITNFAVDDWEPYPDMLRIHDAYQAARTRLLELEAARNQ